MGRRRSSLACAAVTLNLTDEFNKRLPRSSNEDHGETEVVAMAMIRRLSRKELFALQASKSSQELSSTTTSTSLSTSNSASNNGEEDIEKPKRTFSLGSMSMSSKKKRDSHKERDTNTKCRLPCQVIKSFSKKMLSENQPKQGEETKSNSTFSRKKSKTFGDVNPGAASGQSQPRKLSAKSLLSLGKKSKSATLENFRGSFSRSGTAMKSNAKFTVPLPQQEQDHELFFQMISLNPANPQERERFQELEEEIKTYIKKNPSALKVKYDFPVLGGRGKLTVSRYPLFALVALGASLSTIKMAIKANLSALEGQDSGSTVLHTACSFDTNMEVLEYIHSKCPAAIQKTTKLVYLPLHNACVRKEPSLEVIQFLVQQHPEALLAINKLGDTPLRSAERNNTASPQVLQYLQEQTHKLATLDETHKQQWKDVDARQSWGHDDIKNLMAKAQAPSALPSRA